MAKTHVIIFVDRKRKQKVPEPAEISQLHRVKVIKILGVTITNGLSVSPHVTHVQSVIASCAQVLYALRVLRAHGLCDSALHTIVGSRNVQSRICPLKVHLGFRTSPFAKFRKSVCTVRSSKTEL